MERWLHDFGPLKVNDAISFIYRGRKCTGYITRVIQYASCYEVHSPTGEKFTVWLSDVQHRVPRAKWSGLYDHLIDNGSIDQCNALITALDYIIQHGNGEQRGQVISSLRAAHAARTYLERTRNA